ncbi:MAG: serine protease [Planctomycetes bacterium]|nr:serine protease [Planctomycetota bacterium]
MRHTVLIWALVLVMYGRTVSTFASGFDRAIDIASARVVKLYGVGAGMQEGYGTGVLVSPDGQVLTVSSLLIGARRILAVAPDGTRYGASLVHRDPGRQLALLRLYRYDSTGKAGSTGQPADQSNIQMPDTETDSVGPFPFFDLTVEAALEPGDWVIAAGNAFKVADGAERMSIAHGVFSVATRLDARRRVRDFPYQGECLVIDAITSNPGAPGSALVNLEGDFLGMTGRVVLSNLTHTHLNYAIPRSVLLAFVVEANNQTAGETEVAATEAQAPPVVDLGIRLSRAGYRTVLPFVERVRRNSPAARAGIRPDDLILSINGRAVASVQDFDSRMKGAAPGERMLLVIRRGRRILDVQIETDHQP